jgi:Fe-S cluster biogenesis protein NfuA
MSDLQIYPQQTPNPKSLKFILNKNVISEGRATFTTPDQCGDIILARDLLALPQVVQVYFFENVITVTQAEEEWDTLTQMVKSVLFTRMPQHNPNINLNEQKKKARESLPPELQKIEEILDRTVRPGLQSDGGNIEVLKLEGKELFVKYEGACGSCPSATTGTLQAIEDILRNEYDTEIFVTPLNNQVM